MAQRGGDHFAFVKRYQSVLASSEDVEGPFLRQLKEKALDGYLSWRTWANLLQGYSEFKKGPRTLVQVLCTLPVLRAF